MKRPFIVIACVLLVSTIAAGQGRSKRVLYGSNPAAGNYFVHDGVKLYYEVYGHGEPLLVIE